ERSLDLECAVGLWNAALHPRGHLGGGVADIDLAARDVVLAAIERGRLGKPGHSMLGRRVRSGVRPRCVGGGGAIVDNPSAAGLLGLHDPERFLDTEERPRQINIHYRFPLLISEVFKRYTGCTDARIVE